jgi:CBS domain-containing protein
MHINGPGKRLRIYIGESDQWRGRSLYNALLETLKREGLAGATVARGVAGFGAHSRIHTASLEVLSSDLPLVVEVVDRPEQIEKALTIVGPMVREGLITLEDVQIVKYTHRYLHPLPGDKPVREVMTRDVVTVTPETPLVNVMDLLIGQLFKAVTVVDGARQVVGIISDGDLIARGGARQRASVAERLDAETLSAQLADIRRTGQAAQDVMTSPVITVHEDTPLAQAVSLMAARNLKRLPVLDSKERLVGILSRVDVLRTVTVTEARPAHHELPVPPGAAQTVGEVMDTDVPMVPLDAELADIVDQMVNAELKRVIAVNSMGQAVGIINDGDLVARAKPEARRGLLDRLMRRSATGPLPEATAAQLMTPSVLTGPAHMPIAEAVRQMLAQKRKRFVVVDDEGRPVGIVDRQMLLHAVAGITKANGN